MYIWCCNQNAILLISHIRNRTWFGRMWMSPVPEWKLFSSSSGNTQLFRLKRVANSLISQVSVQPRMVVNPLNLISRQHFITSPGLKPPEEKGGIGFLFPHLQTSSLLTGMAQGSSHREEWEREEEMNAVGLFWGGFVFPMIDGCFKQVFCQVGLFFFKKYLYLLIWLPKVLVLSCRLFSCGRGDLVLWWGIKPMPPALGT